MATREGRHRRQKSRVRLKQQLALEAVLQAGEFTVCCTAELAGD